MIFIGKAYIPKRAKQRMFRILYDIEKKLMEN